MGITKMICMKRIQQSFRLDERVKDLFDKYCDDRGLVKERALEALVYGVIVDGQPSAEDIFRNIQELKSRGGGESLTPALPDEEPLSPRVAAAKRELERQQRELADNFGDTSSQTNDPRGRNAKPKKAS